MSKRDHDKDAPAPSPAARKLAKEHGLDPKRLQGTGEGGRLLQRDVMAALANLANDDDEADERREMDGAWPTSTAPPPQPQFAVELVDLGRLRQLTARWSAAFEARHGLPLGLRSFVIKAVVDGLASVPDANVQLHEGQPHHTQYFDVAVTTQGQRRSRTPVVRSPQRKSFADLEGELARFDRQAQDGTLPVEAETGAVITLHHRDALLLSSVPLEPPQCLALAIHRVHERPVVVHGPDGDVVAIRPVCHLTLSWDPRAMEPGVAAALLARIRHGLEQPERLWLEV